MHKTRKQTIKHVLLVSFFLTALMVAFVGGSITGFMARSAVAAAQPTQFELFWEAWDLVNKHFVDQEMIDPTKMTYGAIQGMLTTLGDENHTSFFSPQEAKQQESALEGSFEGIGAYVDQKEGAFHIVAPIHGSPAEKAGVLAGDIVLKVDGEEVTGKPEWEVISKIRGPAGSAVVLTVLHPEAQDPTDITVTRGKIDVESVTWTRIPETDFAYLKLSQFAADTGDELQTALEAIRAEEESGKPIKGILLDLRNNPGGYLQEALRVNSEFLDRGKVILHERNAEGKLRTYKAVGGEGAREIPMIVLINEGTASAGEITAGALQENDRARLIGMTTLGTGTVLQPFTLSDGSVLRLGVTNWLTPDENLLKGLGVKPDIEVDQKASVEMVDSYRLEDAASLEDILGQGDKQFNMGLLQLRLIAK